MDEKEFEDVEELDIDDILEEDEEEEEEVEEKPKVIKKKKGKPKASNTPEVKSESESKAEKYKWKPFVQQAFEGYQNAETGEIIGSDDVIRRILCYAEEAAYNTR